MHLVFPILPAFQQRTLVQTRTSIQNAEAQASKHLIIQVVVLAPMLLFNILDRVKLVDARPVVGGVPAEGDVQVFEESIHACNTTSRAQL